MFSVLMYIFDVLMLTLASLSQTKSVKRKHFEPWTFQLPFIWPLACLFSSDFTPDSYKSLKAVMKTGCIFTSLKHICVIVVDLLKHFVCCVVLQVPQHALQFVVKFPKHPNLKKIWFWASQSVASPPVPNQKALIGLSGKKGTWSKDFFFCLNIYLMFINFISRLSLVRK